MFRYRTTAVVTLLAGALVTGCQPVMLAVVGGTRLGAQDTIIMKPEYVIGDKPIVVIPFADTRGAYFNSPDGSELTTYVVGELSKWGAATNIKPASSVQTAFSGQNLDTVGWDKVAAAAGARLVMVGHIDTFRLRDPGAIMIVRGFCAVRWFIYDAETKTIVHSVPRIEVWLPERGGPIAESDVNIETFRAGVLTTTALKIGQKYYTWQKKAGPPPNRL